MTKSKPIFCVNSSLILVHEKNREIALVKIKMDQNETSLTSPDFERIQNRNATSEYSPQWLGSVPLLVVFGILCALSTAIAIVTCHFARKLRKFFSKTSSSTVDLERVASAPQKDNSIMTDDRVLSKVERRVEGYTQSPSKRVSVRQRREQQQPKKQVKFDEAVLNLKTQRKMPLKSKSPTKQPMKTKSSPKKPPQKTRKRPAKRPAENSLTTQAEVHRSPPVVPVPIASISVPEESSNPETEEPESLHQIIETSLSAGNVTESGDSANESEMEASSKTQSDSTETGDATQTSQLNSTTSELSKSVGTDTGEESETDVDDTLVEDTSEPDSSEDTASEDTASEDSESETMVEDSDTITEDTETVVEEESNSSESNSSESNSSESNSSESNSPESNSSSSTKSSSSRTRKSFSLSSSLIDDSSSQA